MGGPVGAGSVGSNSANPNSAEPNGDGVRRLLLTACGGPFRKVPRRVRVVSVEDRCPSDLADGTEITIDSSTLMNKGLEVIEAHELFGIG